MSMHHWYQGCGVRGKMSNSNLSKVSDSLTHSLCTILWNQPKINFTCLSDGVTPPLIVLQLFKPSKSSASLGVCKKKKNFWFQVFCEWGRILVHITWPRAQTLDRSISLKFSLGTRLESESFKPLIDLLTFLVQSLWSKNNKFINYLISGLIAYFVVFRS